jgi:hypothetical protein
MRVQDLVLRSVLTMRVQDLILRSIAKACVSKDEAANRKR